MRSQGAYHQQSPTNHDILRFPIAAGWIASSASMVWDREYSVIVRFTEYPRSNPCLPPSPLPWHLSYTGLPLGSIDHAMLDPLLETTYLPGGDNTKLAVIFIYPYLILQTPPRARILS